jgi:hypothetical protein
MIALICVASLVTGGVCSYTARRSPKRSAALETYGGVLLIGGLALLGAFLPRY